MAARRRLDAELVRRKLARSRDHAAELIGAGKVQLRGITARKGATNVTGDDSIRLVGETDDYASRGAHKLLSALKEFPDIKPAGLRCLDAGASTGGFTDVLLRQGASQVVAVDVGYGQLAWKLQTDERVTVQDRTNIRHVTPSDIGGHVDLTVGDLSFISLRLVLPALAACTKPDGVLLPMVKPQFEVGRERIDSTGVVTDPQLWTESITRVVNDAAELGWTTVAVAPSGLRGPKGNVEFFCHMRQGGTAVTENDILAVAKAVRET